MRCKAIVRNNRQCINRAKINGFCMIHTKKKYFVSPIQQNNNGSISLGRVRKKSYVDKDIPYYDPVQR